MALCQELKPRLGSIPRMVAGPAMDRGHRQWVLTTEFHTEGKFPRGRDYTQLLLYVHRGMSKPRKGDKAPNQSAEHATAGYAISKPGKSEFSTVGSLQTGKVEAGRSLQRGNVGVRGL